MLPALFGARCSQIRAGSLAASVMLAAGCGSGRSATPDDAALPGGGRRGLQFRADTPANVELAGVYARSHAVVIGIDKYQNVPQLGGAVRDAEVFARALEAHGFEVTLLVDEQATRAAIAEELGDRLHARVGPDDRVIVFFAGHGFSTGDGDTRMGYLLPIEGKRDAVRATSLSMSELQNWLAGYDAKHVMFLADACYSGLALATRSTGLDPGTASYLQEITTKRVRFTLVAGRDDQEAHEDTQSGHGVFTRFVLEGLDGAADANQDGLVTSDELSVYVKPQVSTYVSQNFNSSQTPQSARSGMGEFVFFAKATGATSTKPAVPSGPAVAPAPAVAAKREPPPPVATVTPAPAKAEPLTPPPATTSVPDGVEVAGNVITITTVSAPRHRDNLVKAIASARDQQRQKLRAVLAGPPFNIPSAQLAAHTEQVFRAGVETGGSETPEGDRQLVVQYRAR